MSAPTAPGGFLTLGDAAMRVKDRLRCSGRKAEYKITRAIGEDRIGMASLPELQRVAPAVDMELDFVNSRAIGTSGDGRQVIYLHLGGLGDDSSGGAGGAQEPEPPGTLIVVDEDDVERLLDELAPTPRTTPTMPAAPPTPSSDASLRAARPPSRPNHRPPVYDWPSYELQVRRRVFQHGFPEKTSTLVDEVLDLFCRRDEEPPEKRTVERKIAEWLPSIQTLIEELNSPCEITPLVSFRHKSRSSVAP